MCLLAPTLQAFFTERLARQRQASPHTVTAYRDTFRLLLRFAQARSGKAPSQLEFADLDATVIGAFLEHLEADRDNNVSTRNARLAAVHSLFRYAALRVPEHAALIQRVLAIPAKRADVTDVCFLTSPEVDALLAAPDRATWIGRRDHALLLTDIQTGLRVSELTRLQGQDVQLGTGRHVRCHGKGRIRALWIVADHWLRNAPDRALAEKALERCDLVIVSDLFLTETAERAHVVFPAASFAEREGVAVNSERRLQRAARALSPRRGARADWEVFQAVAQKLGAKWNYRTAEDVFREIARLVPGYERTSWATLLPLGPEWSFTTRTVPAAVGAACPDRSVGDCPWSQRGRRATAPLRATAA